LLIPSFSSLFVIVSLCCWFVDVVVLGGPSAYQRTSIPV